MTGFRLGKEGKMKLSKAIFAKISACFLCFMFLLLSAGYAAPEVEGYAASTIKLNKSKATVYVGATTKLSLDGASGTVTWASSKSAVARVSSSGTVTAVKTGTATITAIYKGESYSCRVSVIAKGPSKRSVTLKAGDTYTIKLNGVKAKSFSSSKKTVAAVSSRGKITAKKKGTARITVKCTNGKSYTVSVTVKAAGKLSAEKIYKKCRDSVVEVNAGIALGSGFYITKNTIVTNYHVIDGATSLSIKTLDGDKYKVLSVMGFDQELDIAVLKVDHTSTPLKKNSHGVTTGEKTYALGSSLGLTDTFSDGMVSNPNRYDGQTGVTYIQTNTAISHGNSGGPLLNAYGEVMGITTSSFTDGQNLNLAIKISELDKISLKNPMTVKEFITGEAPSSGGKKDDSNKGSGSEPDFDAYLDYGKSGKHSSVKLYITNNAKKKLVVGSTSQETCALVYPDQYSVYTPAYYYDSSKSGYPKYVTCNAGASITVELKLKDTANFSKGAYVIFEIEYDGGIWIVEVDEYGHVLQQPYEP